MVFSIFDPFFPHETFPFWVQSYLSRLQFWEGHSNELNGMAHLKLVNVIWGTLLFILVSMKWGALSQEAEKKF